MADRRPTLVIFARAPVAGRVKSRLAQDIGAVAAVWWYRHTLRDTLRRLGRDRRWQLLVAVTPDGAALRPLAVAGAQAAVARFRGQGRGDLGRRMARVLAGPHGHVVPGPVVIVGADVPGILPAEIAEAFAMLGRSEAVFGPAPDGGFWLIGLSGRRPPAGFLAGVRWSGPHALADSLGTLRGRRVAFAAPRADVDTGADLACWRAGRGAS